MMNRKVKNNRFAQSTSKYKKQWYFLQKLAFSLSFLVIVWLFFTTIAVFLASSQPVNAFFVLGGSIKREMYVAELAKKYPQIPILISSGSKDPCIWLIFQGETAPMENVWLEKCADSTFDNFYYGIPILRRWGVRKVKLITSKTHLPRAKWMAQILLGAHGMSVSTDIVKEKGVPGNREYWWKTSLDITRSIFWAGLSQVIQPKCSDVMQLNKVNLQEWKSSGFKCERQGNLEFRI